ncbi:MAG: thiopurine S-methyltransferase [Lysobacter sp.]|nr:thiopurine S-methyltransferase [Lysobacter sp.]
MDPDFWHQRWRDNDIGFHQEQPTPLLQKHWPAIAASAGSRVFVPLAGKSVDMLWLASQGHRVLGVELSPLAVARFFAEHALEPDVIESRYGTHYRAGDIELICGDVFAMDEAVLADCTAVFDRAALIALPPELRQRYVDELYARLPVACRGLLITLEYPAHEKEGPPFTVTEAEVRERYAPHWTIDLLERRDILATEPKFVDQGVSALDTCVYRLQRND